MATTLKLRRGTTTQHSTFTGAEGEVTVDTTKDTLVVHDGTTAGGIPVAKENNVVASLITYGAKGDGVTDDSAAIQAAINSGVKILTGLGLVYKCNARVNLRSNIVLRDAVLDFSSLTALDGSYRTCLKAQGTGEIDNSSLASDAVEGTYSVTVATGQGSKFAAGDFVMLTAEDNYNYTAATVKRGEIKQVQSVTGDVVKFREAIYEGYTTANTAKIRKLSLLENITLDNVKLIGTNIEGNNNIGFRSQYVRNLKIANCEFTDIDLYESALFDTIEFSITNNKYDGVRYTGSGTIFYGIALFNCCQWGNVSGNMGQEIRHLVVTSSSSSYYGQPYFIVVNANVMINAMAGDAYASFAFENHGFGRWITWSNNVADSCYSGINIEKGDQVITGNIFRNCRYAGIILSADAVEMKNVIIANNRLSKITTDSSTGAVFGITAPAAASQVRENILITGNIIDGFGFAGRSDFGIRIYAGSGAAKSCVISNNIIQNNGSFESTDFGIYMEQGGWYIRDNTIQDYERGVSLVSGSANSTVLQGNDFNVTTVSSTQTMVAVGANNCIIKDNVFRNVYRSLSVTGTGCVVSGVTEIGASVVHPAIVQLTTSTYTVVDTVDTIISNFAGTATLTLPSAASYVNREISIKTIQAQDVVSASSNVVPINSGSAGTSILPATAGAWAILKSNGTNWVTRASGTGADALPSQTGNSGKYLTTNGTVASWADVPTGGQFEGTAVAKAISWNAQTIAENITIVGTHNAMSVGPVTVNSGYTVTVNSGARYVII